MPRSGSFYSPMRLQIATFTVALFVVLAGLVSVGVNTYLHFQPEARTEPKTSGNTDVVQTLAPDVAPAISPMARNLANPNGDIDNDLRALSSMFNYFTLGSTRQIPTGTNQEITRALTRAQPNELPYIPAGHPSINEAGELTDRWGTPYFFHALSSQKMEIRSAGPDRKMYSADDYTWPPTDAQMSRSRIFEDVISIR